MSCDYFQYMFAEWLWLVSNILWNYDNQNKVKLVWSECKTNVLSL